MVNESTIIVIACVPCANATPKLSGGMDFGNEYVYNGSIIWIRVPAAGKQRTSRSGGAAERRPGRRTRQRIRAVCVASRAASDSESRRLRRRPRLFDQRCCRLSLRRASDSESLAGRETRTNGQRSYSLTVDVRRASDSESLAGREIL
jgi:hypothetical protein